MVQDTVQTLRKIKANNGKRQKLFSFYTLRKETFVQSSQPHKKMIDACKLLQPCVKESSEV